MLKSLIKNNCLTLIAFCLAILHVHIMVSPGYAAFPEGIIEEIHLETNPCTINIKLSCKPLFKIIQIEKKEVLFAFKNVSISENPVKHIVDTSMVKSIKYRELPDNVVILIVATRKNVKRIQSKWISARQTLSAQFVEEESSAISRADTTIRIKKSLKTLTKKKISNSVKKIPDLRGQPQPSDEVTGYAVKTPKGIYTGIKNNGEANGYFSVVLEKHKDYPGRPQILLEAGKAEMRKKKYKNAIPILRRITMEYPDFEFIADTKIELGKAFFETNNFSESLKILNDVYATNPDKAYESADLLRTIGNNYYHSGEYKKAREYLSKAYNLFPGMKSNHIVLTRIGDTYVDEKQQEKGLKIFKLVTEKFPGTDGFVISSMRIAEFHEVNTEKEIIYNMIINDYPDHPMAKLGILKLAILQESAGEYEKSINTIKKLFKENPRALRQEALYVMQQSFEALISRLMEKNDYSGVLIRFENEKKILSEIQSPNLFYMVGDAYFKGHLYEHAMENLKKADSFFDNKNKPPGLSYKLGISMHEMGRLDGADKMLKKYISNYPSGDNIVKAYIHRGGILLNKNDPENAINSFKKAFRLSQKEEEKALILIDEAKGYSHLGNYKKCSAVLVQAINILVSIPEDHYHTISYAYKNLGETYMKLNAYSKASDAFTMAIKFTVGKEDENYADIRFLLGESYRKGNALNDAEKAYRDVIATGDSFWGKLAEEKLHGLKIIDKLNKTKQIATL